MRFSVSISFSVIAGQREDLADSLVDAGLARADLADAREQFVEVVHQPLAALQPLVVKREALDDILSEALGSPNAELRAAPGFDTIAHGDDDVQVVVRGFVGLAIGGIYPEFPDN
jgi:hypothetical protein